MNLANLCDILEIENIEIDCFEMREVEAFSVPGLIVIDPSKIKDEKDELLKLAHEAGHCVTMSFYNIRNRLDVKSKHERRANIWAIKKLVTADDLHEAVCMGYTEIWELAEYFNIQQDFMEKIVYYYEGLEW